MKNSLVELVIIIDRSGSMEGLEKDVVGGFNSLIKEQSKSNGHVAVTTILFNDKVTFITKRQNIDDIKPMTDKDYVPLGSTALLDAIGDSMAFIKEEHAKLQKEEKPKTIIFSIMTDGMENASNEYSYAKIRQMIDKQKEEGWEFLFQAANIDSVQEGSKIGIPTSDISSFEASPDGVCGCLAQASFKINEKIKRRKTK